MSSESSQTDLTIWNIDFNDLSKQICLKDLELFKAITIDEIDSFNWSKNSKKALCPNLMISNKQFNKINLWVQKEILDQKISVVGTKVISKFIHLSKRLLEYKNFQSAYAVKSALHSTSIYRLEYLWSEISKKDKVTWDKLMGVFNVENNYNNLRKAMSEAKKPCIPFLGIYLSDLTGLDTAFPKIKGVESHPRKVAMERIYSSIKHFQNSKYDFKLNPGIQNFLLSKEYMEEFQNYIIDTLFDLSKALEPDLNGLKQPQSSQITTSIVPSSSFNKSIIFQPGHRKCESYGSNERYRKISDSEREVVFFGNNESPTFKKAETAMKIQEIRNLLDDSIFVKKDNNTENNSPESPFLIHRNDSARIHSPTINISPTIDSNHSILENGNPPVMYYVEPDILTSSINLQLIFEGALKRKMKMKHSSLCSSIYQKVLVRLFKSNLECYLSFFIGKIQKPKFLHDFRDDSLSKVPLKTSKMVFKKLSFNPKIFINLPHEIYVLKSVDEVNEGWPSIDDWWKILNDTQNQVSLAQLPDPQPQYDLINLDDDVTRL